MADEALILAWVRQTLGADASALDERATRHGQTRVVCVRDAIGRATGWWKRAATLDAARREAEALRAVARLAPRCVPELLDY